MLGPLLLVAPVFRDDGQAEYYLPPGRWTDLLTGRSIDGGRWRRERVAFTQISLFVRQNSVIPVSARGDRPGWQEGDELLLHCVEVGDGADVAARAIQTAGGPTPATFVCSRRGKHVTVTGNGVAARVKVLIRSAKPLGSAVPVTTNGSVVDADHTGLLVEWGDAKQPLVIDLAGAADDGRHERRVRPATIPVE